MYGLSSVVVRVVQYGRVTVRVVLSVCSSVRSVVGSVIGRCRSSCRSSVSFITVSVSSDGTVCTVRVGHGFSDRFRSVSGRTGCGVVTSGRVGVRLCRHGLRTGRLRRVSSSYGQVGRQSVRFGQVTSTVVGRRQSVSVMSVVVTVYGPSSRVSSSRVPRSTGVGQHGRRRSNRGVLSSCRFTVSSVVLGVTMLLLLLPLPKG